MMADDTMYYREAEAGAFAADLGGEIWIEYSINIFFADADPGVADFKFNKISPVVLSRGGRYTEFNPQGATLLLHGMDGVGADVQ